MTKNSVSDSTLIDKKAIIHFNGKTLLTTSSYKELKAYEHALAFTVAKMMDADMLKDTRDVMQKAIAQGLSFQEFKTLLKPYLHAKGWGNYTDNRKVLNRRLRVIYQTNLRSARAAGRWQRIQAMKEQFPYLQYMPSVSAKRRDEHRQYYGLIRPVDDSIWQSIYPPNGFGCKCWVKQLTKRQAEKLGVSDAIDPKQDVQFNHHHDRLSALLKLAEEKHGGEFGENLTFQALQYYTGIATSVFFKSNAGGELYSKEKLKKLLASFDKQGIPYLIGEEGKRFANQMGAEAVYYPTEVGISGFFAFPDNPTRTQVIEELLHYGQHKKTGFASLEWKDIVQFEIEAQKKLLVIGRSLNWSVAELEQIERALIQWQAEWDKLNA